jgi:hypothetical protein
MAEQVVGKCLDQGFRVITFQDEENAALLERGVNSYSFDEVRKLFQECCE